MRDAVADLPTVDEATTIIGFVGRIDVFNGWRQVNHTRCVVLKTAVVVQSGQGIVNVSLVVS